MNYREPTRPAFGCKLTAGMTLPLSDKQSWVCECKYNGWRVVVDATTGQCYNRHGTRLSQQSMFTKALEKLCYLFNGELLDCEGLGLKHGIASGSLILLDRMVDGDYWTRTKPIRLGFEPYDKLMFRNKVPTEEGVYSTHPWTDIDALPAMLEYNAHVGALFYEGLVAKRTDTEYISGETDTWRKFRFTFASK